MEPKVGMGATMSFGSDRRPYTVIAVPSPKRIIIQADLYRLLSDGEECEEDEYCREGYKFCTDANAPFVEVTLRKNGRWHIKGQDMNSQPVAIGYRRYYYDPHF